MKVVEVKLTPHSKKLPSKSPALLGLKQAKLAKISTISQEHGTHTAWLDPKMKI